jgi:two-component system chemotaxis response regulator CheY
MKKKILIIDDSLPIRYLLEAIFEKTYAVTSVPDGLAAMGWLSKGNTADLIITDLQMPNIDGPELLEYLSESFLYRDMPVIVLSGNGNPNVSTIPTQYQNVRAIAQKPFDPVQLLHVVEDIFNKQLSEITYP